MNWSKPEHSVSNLILHKSFIPEQAPTTLWFCPISSNRCSATEGTELATSTQLPLLLGMQQSGPQAVCVSCRAAMSCAEDRCPQPSVAQPELSLCCTRTHGAELSSYSLSYIFSELKETESDKRPLGTRLSSSTKSPGVWILRWTAQSHIDLQCQQLTWERCCKGSSVRSFS